MTLKNRLLEAITHPALESLFHPLRRGLGTIFTFHRFESVVTDETMMPMHILRSQLAYLRAQRYAVVSLSTMVDSLLEGRPLPYKAVALTVDDGYADFRDLAAPAFAEFDCPVTLFATTAPIDGSSWFWWDRIEFAFATSESRTLQVVIGGEALQYGWQSARQARIAADHFTTRLKELPDGDRTEAIDRLSDLLGIDTRGPRPAAYEVMTWSDLRRLGSTGLVDVGPHTVTHPILSRTEPGQLRHEIRESWHRVRQECPRAVPVFCYPNGTPADYTDQVVAVVRDEGLRAAVTTREGHVSRLSGDVDERFCLPRFDLPKERRNLASVLTGLERVKQLVRRARTAR